MEYLITAGVTGVAAYAANNWYKKLSKSYPSYEELLTKVIPASNSYEETLTNYVNMKVVEEYCTSHGYDYLAPTEESEGKCVYTKQTCLASSNLEWKSCTAHKDYTFADGTTKCNPNCIDYTVDAEGNECTKRCTVVDGKISSCEEGCYHTDIETGERCLPQEEYLLETCTVKEGGEDEDGNPCDPEQGLYLEWDKDKCIESKFNAPIRKNVCTALGLEWSPATYICDEDGNCDVKTLPTCKLTKEYCTAKGLDYEHNSGIGDCALSEWQEALELFLGTTVTRVYKGKLLNMVEECKRNPVSYKCIRSIYYNANPIYTASEILLKSASKAAEEYVAELNNACNLDAYSSFLSSFKCMNVATLPMYPILKHGITMLKSILYPIADMVPEKVRAFVRGTISAIKRFGVEVVGIIMSAKDLAFKALAIGREALVTYLGPLGGMIVDFTNICLNIIRYGISILRVMIACGAKFLSLFVIELSKAAAKIFTMVYDAILNPEEFFTELGKNVLLFLTDPLGQIKRVFQLLTSLGTWTFELLKRAFETLKGFASAVWLELSQFFNDIANILKGVIDRITSLINQAFRAIRNFFRSWL